MNAGGYERDFITWLKLGGFALHEARTLIE